MTKAVPGPKLRRRRAAMPQRRFFLRFSVLPLLVLLASSLPVRGDPEVDPEERVKEKDETIETVIEQRPELDPRIVEDTISRIDRRVGADPDFGPIANEMARTLLTGKKKDIRRYIVELNQRIDLQSPEAIRKLAFIVEQLTPLVVREGARRGDNPAVAIELDYARRLVEAKPDSPGANVWLADIQSRRSDHRAVVEAAGRAILAGAKDPHVRNLRAHAAYELGDYEAARRDAEAVLREHPRDPRAVSVYRLTEGRTGPSSVGLPDERAVGEDAASGDVASGGGGAVGGIGAGDSVRRSAELTKQALSAIRVRDYSTALRKTAKAISLDPKNARAHRVRASARIKLKNYAEAVSDASLSLVIRPGDPAGLNTRALAYNRMGNYREGFADATAALDADPENALAYFNRAYSKGGLGSRPGMIEELRGAASRNPLFESKLKAALQLAEKDDALFLFEDVLWDSGAAAEPEPEEREGFGFTLFVVLLAGFALSAGILFALLRRRGEGGAPRGKVSRPSSLAQRYDCVRELAAGGMGVVYEAVDRTLGRRVAVKRMREEIRQDKRERERFLSEARTVAKLRHGNIVSIHSIEEEGEDAYLIFEYVEGRTLRKVIEDRGRLSLDQARDVLRGVCEALAYAHRHGVVHRDLKPSNIMIDSDGVIKVMDFGLARQAKDAVAGMDLTNTVIGTFQYMSPELEEGIIRIEGDIFALGVCLYEILAGKRPFDGTPGAVAMKKSKGEYVPLEKAAPEVSAAVGEVIAKALSPKPEDRYRSAPEFFAEFDRAVSAISKV